MNIRCRVALLASPKTIILIFPFWCSRSRTFISSLSTQHSFMHATHTHGHEMCLCVINAEADGNEKCRWIKKKINDDGDDEEKTTTTCFFLSHFFFFFIFSFHSPRRYSVCRVSSLSLSAAMVYLSTLHSPIVKYARTHKHIRLDFSVTIAIIARDI